jgi:hypothetical protein
VNSADLLRAFASPSLTQANRAFRLHWGSAQSSLEQVLIAHRIDISEGLCSGIVGHVTCLSTRADLPLNAFIGLPLSVQMVTDRGALHPICAIVTDARAGQSDGSLATYRKRAIQHTELACRHGGRSCLTAPGQSMKSGSSGVRCSGRELGEVEGQQVGDIGIRRALRQFGQHMHEICVGLDVAGPTREHQAVDHCARFRSGNRVTEQP